MNSYQNYLKNYQDSLNKSKSKVAKTEPDKQKKLNEELFNKQNLTLTQQAQDKANQVNAMNMSAKTQSAMAQELALKYMPTQLKIQGLGQTGAGEQGVTDIRNAYLKAISNQNISTNQMQSDILSQYQNAISQNEQDLLRNNAVIDQNEQERINQEQANYLDYYVSKLDETQDVGTFDRYLEYAKQYLTPENYDTLTQDLELKDKHETLQILYEDELFKKELSKRGVKANAEGIDVDGAAYYSFGKFAGTGKGGEQDGWVNTIIAKAKTNEIPNGTIVDFNVGEGTSRNYVYYNGKFYKTKYKASSEWRKGSKFAKEWAKKWNERGFSTNLIV